MRIINISHSQSFEEGICEHDRACRFLIVAFTLRTVKHLIPHSRLGISPFREHIKEIIELVYQDLASLMILRQIIKHLNQSYCIPAGCTSPRMIGQAGLRIAPEHAARLIPCMTEEARRRIKSILSTGDKLMNDIGKKRILLILRSISVRILRIERKRHIESVKPYLVRIYLLVPELTGLRTRLIVNLFTYHSGHAAIALVLVTEHVMKIKIYTCRTDMVYIVI